MDKIIERWNIVMSDIGCEHIMIGGRWSELEDKKWYYGVESGITVGWMLKEAKYWLSFYFEKGNVRCDDRYEDEYCYATWKSETGKLKRLIKRLEKLDADQMVVAW